MRTSALSCALPDLGAKHWVLSRGSLQRAAFHGASLAMMNQRRLTVGYSFLHDREFFTDIF